ncbi:MAG TPA: glycoside hydrolase family 3 N-terminal domain-containing protein [Longimicrobiales bacterium]|nr:glycoside hydrolase family 3 N-terminal domain-containing protein [Longimicrobiales bacterium]
MRIRSLITLLALAACAPAPSPGSAPAPAPAPVPSPAPDPAEPTARRLVGAATPDPRTPLPPDARAWVDRTLASLTLREKAGQLVMPWVGGEYVAMDSPELDRLLEWVETHGVGGLVLSIGLPHSYAAKLNALQRRAAVPLLIASDMENGPGMRMGGIYSLPHLLPQGGGTAFPPVMALGAAGSEELAYELGRVVGREARAVGVHVNFGPVLDVNSNPANPIINTRSMGEDPALVARLGRAYIRGAHAEGLLTTAKHFPGHGDTSEDSHIELPTITADRARMDTVELPPFRAAVDAGVDAIMTAHISVPGVEGPGAPPATLSRYFMTALLRDDMGFRGLLFTDAMDMGGVAGEFGGGAEVLIRALEAGADVLLMPEDVGTAVDAVAGAVESGRLHERRIDASVRRILEAKARAGLHRGRLVDLEAVDDVVGVRAHTAVAREVAERSLTLARDRGGLVPLRPGSRVLALTYADSRNPAAGGLFPRVLAETLPTDAARVDERTTDGEWEALRLRADSADVVIVTAQVTPREYEGTVDPAASFAAFVESLAAAGKPVVAVSFGSPYLLDGFPSVGTYLLAWGGADVSQMAAADALLGRVRIGGRLPIALPPHHDVGTGIRRAAKTPVGEPAGGAPDG